MVEGGVFNSDCFSEGVGSSGGAASAKASSHSSSVRDSKVPVAFLQKFPQFVLVGFHVVDILP